MIDFHSHILPGMDDGSKSTQESLEMLDMLRAQGVDTVAATPPARILRRCFCGAGPRPGIGCGPN